MGIAETKIPGGDSDLVRGDDMRDRGQRSTSTETGAEARGEGRGVELELGAEQMSELRWSSRCLWREKWRCAAVCEAVDEVQ